MMKIWQNCEAVNIPASEIVVLFTETVLYGEYQGVSNGGVEMANAVEEKIHLPDISFCKVCETVYGVNRGIYNTIDSYFYQKGNKDIVARRQMILSFLQSIGTSQANLNKKSSFKFGHGGLVKKLDAFTSMCKKY
ncbi:hypothetical protein ACTID9_12530 [Brevibacillus fluminis]|uniref:hypothetical protein n=1 Tax=Brevibacillus fluminis TaxID=511487 RepID=UPI003F8B53D8